MAAWQYEVGSSSQRATTYRDLLTKMVQEYCSQHVATVAVNAGGTGYTNGDVLTLTHASAHLDARFEVTNAIAGVIQTGGLRIVANGAFAQQAVSATVSAAGTLYNMGDILRVNGGSSRLPAKFQVATLTGAPPNGIATVTLFEGGGVYATTPSNPAATTKVGPVAGTGSGATLTVTYQAIIGTTGLSVTGGTGTGATVNITLAETGWAVDGRDHNNVSINGLTDEKSVTLVGDASGSTNKPYLHYQTRTDTSGINTRYSIEAYGSIAHNPSIALGSQVGLSPAVYISCDENQVQNMDFWISVTDRRVLMFLNINSGAANTDDGEYMHHHAGYINTFANESEDPYPFFLFGSTRTPNVDPSAVSQNITGLSECIGPVGSSPGAYFFRSETSAWVEVENSEALGVNQTRTTIMHPMGQTPNITSPLNSSDKNFESEVVPFWTGIGSTGRAVVTRRFMPVPGTTPQHMPIPLTIMSRAGDASVNQALDTIRGQLDGVFWIFNTNSSGATITNFSEDYITIGTDRYRVFHTQKNRELYHYVCAKETVT